MHHQCIKCGQKMQLSPEWVGRTAKCPTCHTRQVLGSQPPPVPDPIALAVEQSNREEERRPVVKVPSQAMAWTAIFTAVIAFWLSFWSIRVLYMEQQLKGLAPKVLNNGGMK